MTRNPTLRDVWSNDWGQMPSFNGEQPVTFDTSLPPGLWPNDESLENLRIIAIHNGTTWLSLIKLLDSDALSQAQFVALRTIGFRQGQNGRLIHPAYPTTELVTVVSRVLGCDLEPLRQEQVVSLHTSEQFQPKVPLEVQAAIRRLWMYEKDTLIGEIFDSLKEAQDLPDEIARHLDRDDPIPPFWMRHPMRLQVWVSQALSGDISPTTEPVLALGLARASREYGVDPSEWPEELQALRRELLEHRGIDPDALVHVGEVAPAPVDQRPAIRSEIQWQQDGRTHSGVIVGLPEDLDICWVVPTGESAEFFQKQRKGIPFYVPQKIRVPVSALTGKHTLQESQQKAQKEDSDSLATTASDRAPEQTETDLYDQPKIRSGDLRNKALAKEQPAGALDTKLVRRLQHIARAGGERGLYFRHPLVMGEHSSKPFVIHWGQAEMIMAMAAEGGLSKDVYSDAAVVLRDELIEQFNRAQPKTPGGQAWPLAVLPYGHQMPALFSDDPEFFETINRIEFCRVGIHPRLLPEIEAALGHWREHSLPAIRKQAPTIADSLDKLAFTLLDEDTRSFNELALKSTDVSSHRIRQRVQNAYLDFHKLLNSRGRNFSESVLEEARAWVDFIRSPEGWNTAFGRAHYGIFASYEAAGHVITGHPQAQEQIASLAEKNRRLLMSAADLAGVDRAVLESCDHPLNIILKIVEQNGISNCDRAETMARIGLDLSRNIEILGELIAMQGVSLDMVHRSQHLERISSEEEQNRRDHEQMNAPMQAVRMEAFSGIIRRQGERLPFQIALLDQRDNALSPEAIQVLSNNHSPLLSTKSTLQSSSLGRLADLNNTVKIEFGPALEQEGQLIRPESIAKIEPTVYGFTDIEPNSVDAFRSIGAGFSAYNILQPVAEVKGIGNTPKEALQDTLERNKTILLTGVPAWELDQRLVDQVRSAIALMAEDSKPLSKLANKDRLVQSVLEELKSALNPEILVLAIKATPKKIKWINHVVTKDELEKVNFDRRIAAEYGLLKIKSKNPSVNKTWKYHATLDLANVLRPEAIRYLNELASRDRNLESAANKTKGTKSRGARQDRGTVAGLAIKDLRGNREKVLKRLLDATAEEQARFISKTKLWEAPDWQFLRAPSEEDRNNGERPMDPVVASFFNDLRKAISPKPPANIPEINQLYARLVLGLRDTFNEIRKQDELVASLKKGGEIYELVSSIKQECHAQGWRVNLIFGESLWRLSQDSADAANMVFRYEFDKAFRDTKQNTEWTIKEAIPRTGRGPVSNADEDENEALEDDSRKTGAMPMLSRLVRENAEDYRGGFDVSEEDVIQTFGFSGIEYGKSMNQADRTAYLNHAYDSFLDLSKLLNVPPKALSLGGTLGLAFGSRGRGGKRAAVAHFEPANNAINLTRMKGAGSMAHEYGHALANYFYRISRGVQGSRAPGDITKLLDSQLATEAVSAGQLREPVAQAVVDVLKSLKYREPDDIKELPDSWFAQGAVQADLKDGRKLDNPYWSSIEEMFARAFETYVQIALEEKFPGFRNDFLVRSDKLNHWGDQPYLAKEKAEKQLKESYEKYGYMLSDIRQKVSEELGESSAVDDRVSEILKEREAAHSAKRRRQLYPSGFERENMKKAFDRLFETLKLKDIEVHHEHLGRQDMPVMYSSASGLVERIDEKDHQILAACVFQEVARMCGEKVRVRWRDEIRDEVGALAAGRYISQTKAADTVKGVIEISLSAGLHTAHHEAFHFAQDHLLLREEQTMLDRFFARDAELTHRLINVLAEQGRNDAVAIVQCDPREAQAYAYEEWVKGNLDVRIEEPPVGVFGRINSIFTRTVNLCRKTGFRTPEQLFKAFYSGMLREREEELAAKHNQSDSNKQQWIDATQHTVLNSCEDIDALSSNRELDWPHSSAQLH